MPHSGDPEPLQPLTDLVRKRLQFFTNKDNSALLHAIATHRNDAVGGEDAKTRVDTYTTDFFARLFALAAAHDLQTTVMWAARLRKGMRGSKAAKSRFLRRRLLLGIRKIKRGSKKGRKESNGFDLGVDEATAFKFFKQGLRLAIKGENRDALRRLLRELRLDESIEAILAATAEETPDDEPEDEQGENRKPDTAAASGKILGVPQSTRTTRDLVLDDLPEQLRAVVGLLEEGKDENLEEMERVHMAGCRIGKNHLEIAHECAQTEGGRARIAMAALFLEKEEDRRLVILHFTVRGDPPHDELFEGRPLDELAGLKKRSKPDAKKMREWLLRCLAKIVALIDQVRDDAWNALPAAQKELLEVTFAFGPVAYPSPAVVEALRDLNDLREVFERASNPRKHNKPWKARALSSENERVCVKVITTNRRKFWEVAEKLDKPVDAVKRMFLALVKKIINDG